LTTLSSEVYGPSEDSFALADALLQLSDTWTTPPKLCVEVGCGTGYVITSAVRIVAARNGGACQFIATDISEPALAATRATLIAHKVHDAVEVTAADLLGPLLPRLRRSVDLLLFNPPYVPTPDDEVTRGGIAASWAGGSRGRVVIDRLLAQLDSVLAPGGQMLMVTVAENDPQGILRELADIGFAGRIVSTTVADEEVLTILLVQRNGANTPRG
jgi:release factor glutamine methyltransferase